MTTGDELNPTSMFHSDAQPGGRYELWLHGVDCKRPAWRRQTETRTRRAV